MIHIINYTFYIFIADSINQGVFLAEISLGRTYQKCSIWIYDELVTNVGNAYNPSIKKSTLPTKGTYQFNWYTSIKCPNTMLHAKMSEMGN